MDLERYATFRAAGLPEPALQADTIVGGEPDFGGYAYLAAVIRGVLPLMERYGVAMAEAVGIDTLADRLRAEVVSGGVLPWQMIVGASWFG